MIKLILVRHGKSGYEGYSSDKERNLSEIGIERTVRVALDANDFIDESFVFYSSSSTRAFSTAAIFSEILKFPKEKIIVFDDLYTFNTDDLQRFVSEISNEINSIVIFGHNPAFTDFINQNSNLNIDNLPTSVLVLIEFESENWKNLHKGKVIKTLFPKDL